MQFWCGLAVQAKAGEGCETMRRLGWEQCSFARASREETAMLRKLVYIYKEVLDFALCYICTEGFYKLFLFSASSFLVFLKVNLMLIDIVNVSK